MRHSLLPSLSLGFLAFAAAPAEAQQFFAVDEQGDLYRYDVQSASRTLVGNTGVETPAGLEVGPDGSLYMTDAADPAFLYTVSLRTGAATQVGPLFQFSEFAFEGGLAIAPDGRAWGATAGTAAEPQLFEIDLATGKAEVVGVLAGGKRDLNGIAWRKDGMLVAVDRISNALVAIDPTTADVKQLATLSVPVTSTGGAFIVGGAGYFVVSPEGLDQFWAFDPFTGAHGFLAELPGGVDDPPLYGLALGNPLLAAPSPGVAGVRNVAASYGSRPFGPVALCVSRGLGSASVPTLLGVTTLDLGGLDTFLVTLADQHGTATFETKTSSALAGVTLFLQAVDLAERSVGNVVELTF